MCMAVKCAHLEVAKELIAHGAELEGNGTETPLISAANCEARGKRLEMVNFLLDVGANPGAMNHGVMHAAASYGCIDTCLALAKAGCRVASVQVIEACVGGGRCVRVAAVQLAHCRPYRTASTRLLVLYCEQLGTSAR